MAHESRPKCLQREPRREWCEIGEPPPPGIGLDDAALEKLLVDPLIEAFLRAEPVEPLESGDPE